MLTSGLILSFQGDWSVWRTWLLTAEIKKDVDCMNYEKLNCRIDIFSRGQNVTAYEFWYLIHR